ncbi:MAG: twin-arginine translocase subunit TatC [Prevotella sp.]|jgi:sec-independent protein translocase protein TatC|nr:twin-arginine translocase subunit TatC [Prevotella sp.]
MAEDTELTFWEHLDILRAVIIKILVVGLLFGLVAFCFKDQLFDIVLAPKSSKFISYRLMGVEPFDIKLVNIGITEQFMIHMKTALGFGLLGASPYILYQLYQFIAPALYNRERHYAVKIVLSGYIMFLVGVLVNYFIIFPLTVRFLGTYSVSEEVGNLLSLQSYMDTLLMMSIVFGVVFEIPVISWLLAIFGLLKAEWMRKFRKQAFVVILIIAAVITPTSDVFTLTVVTLPIWLLYESSILIVAMTNKADKKALESDDATEVAATAE